MYREQELRSVIETSVLYMLDRFESNPDYRFIDTKFNIRTGKDFSSGDDFFYQRDYIYGWIQGRGLESLAKHILWFGALNRSDTAERLKKMLAVICTNLFDCIKRNGSIYFAMRPDGSAIMPPPECSGDYSRLFFAKGLSAASQVLNNPVYGAKAGELFLEVLNAVADRTFISDQYIFDSKNPGGTVSGRFAQGPMMIALGGLAVFMQAKPEEACWQKYAEDFIAFILKYHVNNGQYPDFERFDFIEFLDQENRPWQTADGVLCDPGHALEFVGLAGKCLLLMKNNTLLQKIAAEILPELFIHIFELGFQPGGGIMKSYSLSARRPVNTDMPWWSLPESIRAGHMLLKLYPDHPEKEKIEQCIRKAADAMLDGFISGGTHGFACQTRDVNGVPVPVIPAVPDADPGYHTNLSLLDCLFTA